MDKKRMIMLILANLVVVLLLLFWLWPTAALQSSPPSTTVISSPVMSHMPDAAPAEAVSVDALAAKIDPVCDMHLEEHGASATALYEGKTYGFCSAYCKGEFEKDPAKYLAKMDEAAKK